MSDIPLLLTIGRGGWTIYYRQRADGSTSRLLGYGDETSPHDHGDHVREVLALGIPCIDTRTIPDERIAEYAIRSPLVAQGEPDKPKHGAGLFACGYGALAAAPVSVHVAIARAFGARVLNVD